MSFVLVAIADPSRTPLDAALIDHLARRLGTTPRWLADDEAAEVPIDAVDLPIAKTIVAETMSAANGMAAADLAILPGQHRRKRLLISDMDSTMITVECIDELADFAGIKGEVAAITRRAMNGELDFAGALQERVALLAGLPADVIQQVYAERVRMMPGALTLVQTMRRWGAATALVSGGFVPFARRVADALGFESVIANRLEVKDGWLTGRVLPPITGADAKVATLERLRRANGLDRSETLAVGDGANDLPMIKAAGLGVGYHPHATVASESDVTIKVADLTALLYLQGVPKSDFFVK